MLGGGHILTWGLLLKMNLEETAMGMFTNRITLSCNGSMIHSTTVAGELSEVLSVTKEAVSDVRADGNIVTYLITIRNTGPVSLVGLTLTDDLGGHESGGARVYPLSYEPGSVRCWLNGTTRPAPLEEAGPPLVLSGICVPAGGNATLVYRARVSDPAYPGDAAGNTVTGTA